MKASRRQKNFERLAFFLTCLRHPITMTRAFGPFALPSHRPASAGRSESSHATTGRLTGQSIYAGDGAPRCLIRFGDSRTTFMHTRFLLFLSLAFLVCAPIARADRTFTATITTVSASGSVGAGARSVTFVFSSDFSGTVLGATFAGSADSSITIAAPSGDMLEAITYTRSAGSIRILVVR
jgi:hypothetical protein